MQGVFQLLSWRRRESIKDPTRVKFFHLAILLISSVAGHSNHLICIDRLRIRIKCTRDRYAITAIVSLSDLSVSLRMSYGNRGSGRYYSHPFSEILESYAWRWILLVHAKLFIKHRTDLIFFSPLCRVIFSWTSVAIFQFLVTGERVIQFFLFSFYNVEQAPFAVRTFIGSHCSFTRRLFVSIAISSLHHSNCQSIASHQNHSTALFKHLPCLTHPRKI